MTDPDSALTEGAAAILGAPLDEGQVLAFRVYLDCLEAWNRIHRLVGGSDRGWLVENVVLDSLLFLRVLPRDFQSLLDIGSGAGVPGIPIAIMRPGVAVTLVESRRKRASFLGSAVRSIGLNSVTVAHDRAEVLVASPRRFEVVVARCAGRPDAMLEVAARLVTDRGSVVVAGAPKMEVPAESQRLEIRNPATGSTRTFISRRSPEVEGA